MAYTVTIQNGESKCTPAGQSYALHLLFLLPADFECLLNSRGFFPGFLGRG